MSRLPFQFLTAGWAGRTVIFGQLHGWGNILRRMSKSKPLSPKQKRFVSEYLIDLNATAAYGRAGYKGKGSTATVNASRMLANANISAEIAKKMQKREERTEITQDRVLRELARVAFFDIRKLYAGDGSLKRPADLDDDTAAALSGIDVVEMAGGAAVGGAAAVAHIPMYTKKVRAFDKGVALTLAMRHLGMLLDKTELTGKDGAPLRVETSHARVSLDALTVDQRRSYLEMTKKLRDGAKQLKVPG
jgi:phage terminase small subunit